jgi:hypothetical protein
MLQHHHNHFILIRAINEMPTFKAHDGVTLNYETHGSASNKPLVLVIHPALHRIQVTHLILHHSYTASQALEKSSNAM